MSKVQYKGLISDGQSVDIKETNVDLGYFPKSKALTLLLTDKSGEVKRVGLNTTHFLPYTIFVDVNTIAEDRDVADFLADTGTIKQFYDSSDNAISSKDINPEEGYVAVEFTPETLARFDNETLVEYEAVAGINRNAYKFSKGENVRDLQKLLNLNRTWDMQPNKARAEFDFADTYSDVALSDEGFAAMSHSAITFKYLSDIRKTTSREELLDKELLNMTGFDNENKSLMAEATSNPELAFEMSSYILSRVGKADANVLSHYSKVLSDIKETAFKSDAYKSLIDKNSFDIAVDDFEHNVSVAFEKHAFDEAMVNNKSSFVFMSGDSAYTIADNDGKCQLFVPGATSGLDVAAYGIENEDGLIDTDSFGKVEVGKSVNILLDDGRRFSSIPDKVSQAMTVFTGDKCYVFTKDNDTINMFSADYPSGTEVSAYGSVLSKSAPGIQLHLGADPSKDTYLRVYSDSDGNKITSDVITSINYNEGLDEAVTENSSVKVLYSENGRFTSCEIVNSSAGTKVYMNDTEGVSHRLKNVLAIGSVKGKAPYQSNVFNRNDDTLRWTTYDGVKKSLAFDVVSVQTLTQEMNQFEHELFGIDIDEPEVMSDNSVQYDNVNIDESDLYTESVIDDIAPSAESAFANIRTEVKPVIKPQPEEENIDEYAAKLQETINKLKSEAEYGGVASDYGVSNFTGVQSTTENHYYGDTLVDASQYEKDKERVEENKLVRETQTPQDDVGVEMTTSKSEYKKSDRRQEMESRTQRFFGFFQKKHQEETTEDYYA